MLAACVLGWQAAAHSHKGHPNLLNPVLVEATARIRVKAGISTGASYCQHWMVMQLEEPRANAPRPFVFGRRLQVHLQPLASRLVALRIPVQPALL